MRMSCAAGFAAGTVVAVPVGCGSSAVDGSIAMRILISSNVSVFNPRHNPSERDEGINQGS